jgi:hypothetical protein
MATGDGLVERILFFYCCVVGEQLASVQTYTLLDFDRERNTNNERFGCGRTDIRNYTVIQPLRINYTAVQVAAWVPVDACNLSQQTDLGRDQIR